MTYNGDFSYPISKKLGKKLGLPAALMLGQLEYWTQREAGIVRDGLRWIYNSLNSWSELLEVLTPSQVRSALQTLRDRGLVLFSKLKKHQWDHTGHYAIVQEKVDQLLGIADSAPSESESDQSSAVIDEKEETGISAIPVAQQVRSVAPRVSDAIDEKEEARPRTSQATKKGALKPLAASLPFVQTNQPEAPAPKPPPKTELSGEAKAIIKKLRHMGVETNYTMEKVISTYPLQVVEKAYETLRKLQRDGSMPNNPGGWLVSAIKSNCWEKTGEGEELKVKEWMAWTSAAESLGLIRGQMVDKKTSEVLVIDKDNTIRPLEKMMELHPNPQSEVEEQAGPSEEVMKEAVSKAVKANEIQTERYFDKGGFLVGVKELVGQGRWWGTVAEWFKEVVESQVNPEA